MKRVEQQCLYITAPVGHSIPKVPRRDKGDIVEETARSSLTLLCPAQAFPLPHYR